ncbi:nuclear inhibitor of protein phosphatase 1 protein [Dioscorea alata]|uniref:Nuclear inhibitor of protein phosphatase 1 protein n=2 Tax=Dioscorea alata TaxID=55571 RepID=A0ACB7W9X6_DIOAL|nr:nuclear inhibitor of protein phosphatase 1 protein [Dioscorea alata]KAH7684185.1 nuclear inhibitor of protein phosphatase 1 protein [Dioscorea alata]
MYRGGLDRFKKAQSIEPFSVGLNSSAKTSQPPKINTTACPPPVTTPKTQNSQPPTLIQQHHNAASKGLVSEGAAPAHPVTQIGGGQSVWQPPDWAIEPRPGVYYLEVLKDGEVLDRINLDKRRHIFGRQMVTCDFVLDHQSVSRQHAAVVPHKNGSVYVIDLGSVHGTFVANERLTKDNPLELEVGQSLKFAASTRTYILRKNSSVLFPAPVLPAEVNLPSPPDPSDEDAVVAYNTVLNRYGLRKSDVSSKASNASTSGSGESQDNHEIERPAKRNRRARVAFKDQVGGQLVEVVGTSDGADIETEPGPIGVKEGSLVGKYESLVQITVIPKGKEQMPSFNADNPSPKGVTDKLQQVLNKVKSVPRSGIYDDLYGDSFSGKLGSSWASKSDGQTGIGSGDEDKSLTTSSEKHRAGSSDESDDLFGD